MPCEISVVICYHTGNFIQRCVESVKSSFGANFEIIIMSSDPGLKIPGCRIFHSTDTPAKKRNLAAYQADGKYLCFLDDDVTVTSQCLRSLRKTLDSKYTGMVFSKLWNMQYRNLLDDAGSYLTRNGFLWSRAGQLDKDVGQYDRATRVLSGKSACCMIKKDIFFQVGQFDESFGILGEETDLSWRVWLAGHDVYYQPRATGYHAFNTDYKSVDKHYTTERVQYNGCRNYITMLLKNLEARNLWRIVPLHVLIWTFVGLAMLITGKVKQGWNIWKGIGFVIKNWRSIMRKRAVIQSGRLVSDTELFQLIMARVPKGYYLNRGIKYLQKGLHG